MYDSFLIRSDSLENVVENGWVIGFRFGVKQADYRGSFLSLHNGYYIEVDGEVFPREQQKFEINGKPPRDFEELKTCVWEHWDSGTEAFVYVQRPGGLAPGMHHIGLEQSVLSHYGYADEDEEWVQHPPVPGQGGGGKTNWVCYFDLELQK